MCVFACVVRRTVGMNGQAQPRDVLVIGDSTKLLMEMK